MTMEIPFIFKRVSEKIQRKGFLSAKRLIQTCKGFQHSDINKKCVFVCGNQRSGTNMMMNVLERSLDTDVYHETNPIAFCKYKMREMDIIRKLIACSPSPCVVFKALFESHDVRRMIEKVPNAQVIWMLREYNDVVNSMIAQFSNMAEQIKRVAADKTGDRWERKGMSNETYTTVRNLVHSGIDDASASALQWYYRNILYLEQQLHKNHSVILVKYEDIVLYPEDEFKSLFEFLGLKFQARVCKRIFSSSIRRNLPPKIDPAIRVLCDELMAKFNDLLIYEKTIG